MPFALRKVQPEYVSRARLHDQDGRPLVQDDELEAVFNHTLCQAIRQLSSLLEAADDMFAGLTKEMAGVTTRAGALQERIKKVQDLVDAEDPRIVPVPEGDLCAFAALPRDAHFSQESRRPVTLGLFSAATRPAALQQLYEAASRPALDARALQQLDRMRRDGKTTSNLFLCRPYSKPAVGEGRGRAPRARGRQARRDREETLEIETMKLSDFK
ncbi:actin-binding protein WASF1-like [Frankliniella occidentalis]|uniref:Actin-binding protein WASF1-like n=1 Tax=Frankliniella occidentalis TaxID=133901 RepID=A0A9C6U5W4_FRAOC|nr:actin-binding protein WASF1-like [Frankliniella occidentalis]